MSGSPSIAALGDLATLQATKVFANKDPRLPYVGLEHIAQGEPRLLGVAESSSSVSVNSVFQKNDILFGKLRPNLRKSLRAPFDGYCSTDILVLRCQDGVMPGFAGHVFQWDRVFDAAVATAAGTKMPRTSWNDLRGFRVFKPESQAEQSRISGVLDAVDEAIAKTVAVIAKLKQVRTGLLHDLLARGLDEHGQLRPPPAEAPHLYQDSHIGKIPRGWEIISVEGMLARVPSPIRSGPFGSALLKQELKLSGIPLLGIDNVHVERFEAEFTRFVDEEKFHELKRYAVRPGDVMITIMGTVGRSCVVPDSIGPALSSKHVWTITFDCERYSPRLACWQINHAPWVLRQLRRDEQGGVMSSIRSETLRNLLLPVPPPPELRLIEDALVTSTDSIAAEEKLLPKLIALKSGLMADLLAGRVRVPDNFGSMEACP